MSHAVRVVVVGAGSAAQVVHLPILRELREAEVVGLADRRAEKARAIADRFDIPEAGPSPAEIEAYGGADAVVVCTPTSTHEEIATAALEDGKHVLCERPISTGSESAARMIEAAREAGRTLMVAMNQRFQLDLRHIREFVGSGEIGTAFFVRSAWLNPRGRQPRKGWRRDPDRAGGGVLMDLGVPALDLALWLLGYPGVERLTARLHGDGPVEDSAVVLLSTEVGSTASVEVSWELIEARNRHRVYVLGSEGSATTPPFRMLKRTEGSPKEVTPPLDLKQESVYRASYRKEWGEFLRLVRGEVERRPQEEQEVELMRVVEACYRSAREGREVRV